MLPQTLFWMGIESGVLLGGGSLFAPGQTKLGVAVIPFTLLLGAAVAKYIGI